MYEQVEKTPKQKSHMGAKGESQIKNSHAPTSRFVDKRPEAIQMRRLRDLAKNSPQNAKLRELHHLADTNSVAQKKSNVKQGFGFTDNRLETVAQRRLQELVNKGPQAMQLKTFPDTADNRARLIHPNKLKKDCSFSGGETIQLVNGLTMHSAPQDTRLAGGGIDSGVDTGQEVQDVIDSGNLQDMMDSRNALKLSIAVRSAALNPDANHAARIVQEQGWLQQLNEAIRPLEESKKKAWQDSLRGPKPPPSSGPGWTPPAGPVWGKS